MTMTREQRDTLTEISTELTGKPNEWIKIRKDPKLQIFDGTTKRTVVTYRNEPTGKPGKFICRKNKEKVTEEVVHTRPMNFDELYASMVAALEMKNLAEIYKEGGKPVLFETVVSRYLLGILTNQPFLVVQEDQRKDFDDLFARLPDEHQKALAGQVVPNKNDKRFCLDGGAFVTELTFQLSHPEADQEVSA